MLCVAASLTENNKILAKNVLTSWEFCSEFKVSLLSFFLPVSLFPIIALPPGQDGCSVRYESGYWEYDLSGYGVCPVWPCVVMWEWE